MTRSDASYPYSTAISSVFIYYNSLWVKIKLNAEKWNAMTFEIIKDVYVTESDLLMYNILVTNLSCQGK